MTMSPIDKPTAVERLGGDEQLFFDFARGVMAEAPSMHEEIQQALGCQDFEKAHMAAHALKGLLATLEARPATQAAGDVERLATEQKHREATVAADQLSVELARLQSALQTELADA